MFSIVGKWSPAKIDKFIRVYKRYIRRYSVSLVIINVQKSSHFSLALKQLIRVVEEYLKKQGCRIEYLTIEQIKQYEPSIKNRNDLREYVVSEYPDLLHKKLKDVRNRQRHISQTIGNCTNKTDGFARSRFTYAGRIRCSAICSIARLVRSRRFFLFHHVSVN
jgi:hypothetical protein